MLQKSKLATNQFSKSVNYRAFYWAKREREMDGQNAISKSGREHITKAPRAPSAKAETTQGSRYPRVAIKLSPRLPLSTHRKLLELHLRSAAEKQRDCAKPRQGNRARLVTTSTMPEKGMPCQLSALLKSFHVPGSRGPGLGQMFTQFSGPNCAPPLSGWFASQCRYAEGSPLIHVKVPS